MIKMRGIPFDSSENDIFKFFEMAQVRPLKINRSNNSGEAMVEFEQPAHVCILYFNLAVCSVIVTRN